MILGIRGLIVPKQTIKTPGRLFIFRPSMGGGRGWGLMEGGGLNIGHLFRVALLLYILDMKKIRVHV